MDDLQKAVELLKKVRNDSATGETIPDIIRAIVTLLDQDGMIKHWDENGKD